MRRRRQRAPREKEQALSQRICVLPSTQIRNCARHGRMRRLTAKHLRRQKRRVPRRSCSRTSSYGWAVLFAAPRGSRRAGARCCRPLSPGFCFPGKSDERISHPDTKARRQPDREKGIERGRVNSENVNYAASTTCTSDGLGRDGATAAQEEFFHATNAATVQSVLGAIELQVERLLPEGASKSARNRVVGEIYRELDNTLRSNRQLAQQMREAFRSGALDADHSGRSSR